MQSALSVPGLFNARDLGGYPTIDGRLTRRSSLVRADDLAQLKAEGLKALEAHGIRTVLDLRWPEESARDPNPVPQALPHVRFVHVSLLTRTEEEWRLRSRDVAKELWKCGVLEHVRHELRRALGVIAQAPPGTLLFHCVAGKDRTGLIAALLLALADVEPQAIAYDYAVSTHNLRGGVPAALRKCEPGARARGAALPGGRRVQHAEISGKRRWRARLPRGNRPELGGTRRAAHPAARLRKTARPFTDRSAPPRHTELAPDERAPERPSIFARAHF